MADNEIKTGKKKPHPAIFIGVIVLILLVLGFAQFVSRKKDDQGSMATAEQTATAEATEAAVTTDETVIPPATTDETTAATPPPTPGTTSVTVPSAAINIDVNAALSDRIFGDTSAPVRVSEHASLTCPHCGDFHRETFDKLKKEYIDTKKVYFVFSDFPLNEPALKASMVARCLPESKYFDFISMLFKDQDQWAISSDYMDFLKKQAAAVGFDGAHVDACVANKEIENGILNRMKGIQQQWNINSTPSFVINNRNTVSGAIPYNDFKKLIDTELEGKKAAAPAEVQKSETKPAAEEEKAAEPAANTTAPAASTTETATPPAEEGVTDEPVPPSEDGSDGTQSEDSGKNPAQ